MAEPRAYLPCGPPFSTSRWIPQGNPWPQQEWFWYHWNSVFGILFGISWLYIYIMCMYIYICMYIYMYVCIYIYVYVAIKYLIWMVVVPFKIFGLSVYHNSNHYMKPSHFEHTPPPLCSWGVHCKHQTQQVRTLSLGLQLSRVQNPSVIPVYWLVKNGIPLLDCNHQYILGSIGPTIINNPGFLNTAQLVIQQL